MVRPTDRRLRFFPCHSSLCARIEDHPRSPETRTAVHRRPVGRWCGCGICDDLLVAPRFLTLADVAETLNISAAQTYALVRSGDLPAIKIGGRGQWRVESTALEEFIARKYEQTREFVRTHPFGSDE